jgi:hypothetical protein
VGAILMLWNSQGKRMKTDVKEEKEKNIFSNGTVFLETSLPMSLYSSV